MDNWWFSGLALFIYSVVFIGIILAWAEIFIKAGQNRWLCFLFVIPVVNLIVFFWFAYSKWPIHEGIGKDWKLKILEAKKVKLETEIKSLKPTQKSTQSKKEE
jgi:type VI protein secretion system component VasK